MERAMYRQLLLATIAGFISCSAHAFSGFYAGGELGVAYTSGDNTYRDPFDKDEETFSALGFLWGGHVGYVHEIGQSRTVIGVELYLNSHAANVKEDLKGGNPKAKVGTFEAERIRSIGAGLIIGKLLNPKVLGYVKIALERANFEVTYKNRNVAKSTEVFKKNLNGLVPFVGIKYSLKESIFRKGDRFLIGAEYGYAGFFGKIKNDASTANHSYTYDQTEHRIFFKFSYMM
jgi:hypothetical protein